VAAKYASRFQVKDLGKGRPNMKNLFHKLAASRKAQVITGAAVAVSSFATAGLAGATTYDPTSALSTLTNNVATTASPIFASVTGELIPLGIVLVVVAWIMRIFHLRKKA
jgi:hypothetical protein